jgi:ABC-2 type transport system permease protein
VNPFASPRDRVVHALRWLRWRQGVNHARSIVRGSWLRVALVLGFSALFWALLYLLFRDGFRFVDSILPSTNEIIEFVLGLFFLSLLVMLVVSSGILVHASLFQGEEAAFLLTLPAADDRVFAHLFRDGLVFASWGLFLLGSPMLAAYGVVAGSGWPFFLLVLPYLLAFVVLAGSLGAVGSLLVARYAPRRTRTILGVMLAIAILTGLVYAVRLLGTPGQAFTLDWLDALLDRLSASQSPWLPSRWLARGLVSAARGDLGQGLYDLAILAAHAAAAYLLAAWTSTRILRTGFSRTRSASSARRRHGFYELDAAFHRLFGFLPRTARLLILKDLRSFRRDPAQWAQFLIFFGLLGLYFLNIQRLNSGDSVWPPFWKHVIGFLNLSVAALILSTFTTRFVFPLLSLEGRNLWVLGLLPMSRRTILWGKFLFAAGLSLVSTVTLVVLSDLMLRLPAPVIGFHVLAIAILCAGLAAISVGLGAMLPDLRQEDPSKIAAGLGGTLNLVLSLVYIAVVVALLAIPAPWYLAALDPSLGPAGSPAGPALCLAAVLATSLVVGALATWLPMRAGIRAFESFDI